MLAVCINRGTETVAYINRQDKAADGHDPALPWLLLLVDGRTRKFPTCSEAKGEACKRWAPVAFKRT